MMKNTTCTCHPNDTWGAWLAHMDEAPVSRRWTVDLPDEPDWPVEHDEDAES